MRVKTHIWIVLLAVVCAACRDVPTIDVQSNKGDTLRENMIAANRIISQSEETQIDAYMQRHHLQSERTVEGVRIAITQHGHGAPIAYDDNVEVVYNLETLGGQTVYEHVQETVVVGRHKPTRGLDAALRHLRRGDQACIIVPSEQGYGVVGDGNRIGTRLVLVYKLECK